MQRQRGELVSIGEVVADLDGQVMAIGRSLTPGAAGLHGPHDGAVLVAPEQARQPASVGTDEWLD